MEGVGGGESHSQVEILSGQLLVRGVFCEVFGGIGIGELHY